MYSFRESTDRDDPKGTVYMENQTEEGIRFYVWNGKKWVPSETACGAFVGFEPSRPITEAEALKFMGVETVPSP